jgi:precorrin-6B methylase 1
VVCNKVVKAMTTKDFRIVAQSREIDGLKRQLEVVHPSSKRAQVNYNPQEQFADIKLLRGSRVCCC